MKKAVIIYIINTLLFATCVYGQQSRFKITYDYNGQAEWAQSILFPGDTTMWVNTSYSLLAGGGGVLMAHLGFTGAIISQSAYEKPHHSYEGFMSGSLLQIDSNYYVGGLYQWQDSIDLSKGFSFPWVGKFKLNGDTVWTKYYLDDTLNYYQGTSFTASQDGKLLLAGSVSSRITNVGRFNYFLLKIDTSGNLLWQKTYGQTGADERNTSVEELPDSSIVLAGMKSFITSSNTNYQPWIVKTDKNGNLLLSKLYTFPSMKYGGVILKQARSGYGYWASGLTDTLISPTDALPTHQLIRMAPNFNVTRRKFFNSPWFIQIWDFYELNNGDVVFCGDKEDSATGRQFGYIAKIDSNGTLLWWRTYHELTLRDGYLSCIRPAPDGGFVACGSAFGVNSLNQDAWIIKTDSLGCALVDCTLGIPEIEEAKPELLVYPNPAKDEINVSMNTGMPGEGTVISAYDITGRRMVRYVPEPGRQKATLNSSGWSSGIYIITVQRSNGALTTTKVTIAR